jgi:dihydroorotase
MSQRDDGAAGRKYDLVLRGGTVIDAAQGLHRQMDVAVQDGRISALEDRIEGPAGNVVDVSEKLVVAGLIDLHTHVYWGGTSLSIDPEQILKRSGVTTWVDAGSAGAGNFSGFHEFIIKRSKVRILPFLNIAYGGIFGFIRDQSCATPFDVVGELIDIRLAHHAAALQAARKYEDVIVGMKIRSGIGDSCAYPGLAPVQIAKKVAEDIGKPLMVHIGFPPPTTGELLSVLSKGDILTHCFRGNPNSLLDEKGEILSEFAGARQRGVLIDLGHGAGSFCFETAGKLLNLGIEPDIISSDLHAFSVEGPAFDLPTTMSKMLNIGMSKDNIIAAVTQKPAKAIGFEDELGSLRIGTIADITVLDLKEGEFIFQDCFGNELTGEKRLVPVIAIKDGEIIT